MKKAAIVIDDWKLPIFKRILEEEGYQFTQHNGPVDGCITLDVRTESIAKLKPVVERMNAEAARSRKH